jgi:histone H2A
MSTDQIAAVPAAGRGGAARKKRTESKSRSQRAGITFPVGRIHNRLRHGRYAVRCGNGAAVYTASVMEYLTAEVLELAGNAAKDLKKRRIVPRHLVLAIKGDEELATLTKDAIFSQGGVLPAIHKSLLPAEKPEKKPKPETLAL